MEGGAERLISMYNNNNMARQIGFCVWKEGGRGGVVNMI